MTKLTALQLYKHLPKTNCGLCGEKTCIDLALKLLEREKSPEECKPITAENLKALKCALTPAVKETKVGDRIVGGEEVMFRHELRYFNPPLLLLEVSDLMNEGEIMDRVKLVRELQFDRLGSRLSLDGVAIKSSSDNPKKFASAVKVVSDNPCGVIALCSLNPKVLEAGLRLVEKKRPLLYAATEENCEQVLSLAKRYHSPTVLYSPKVEGLVSLSKRFSSAGVGDLIIDSGYSSLADIVNSFTFLRAAAIAGIPELRHPLMFSSSCLWLGPEKDEMKAFNEFNTAAMLVFRYASVIILRSSEVWGLLPLLTLRQNIYSDPRAAASVEPKVYEVGSPDRDSPVLLTTNFALTYFNVCEDLKKAEASCFLLVMDTEGLAVSVSVAADKITPKAIKSALESNKLNEKVSHRKLIVPGAMAQIKDSIEEETGWSVIVGPQDSSQLGEFLKEKWSTR